MAKPKNPKNNSKALNDYSNSYINKMYEPLKPKSVKKHNSMMEQLNKFYQPWFDKNDPGEEYDQQYINAKIFEEEINHYEDKLNQYEAVKEKQIQELKDQQTAAYKALMSKFEALQVAKTPEPIIKAETALVYVHGMNGSTTPLVLKPGTNLQIKTKDGYICAIISVDRNPPSEEKVQETVVGPRIVEV